MDETIRNEAADDAPDAAPEDASGNISGTTMSSTRDDVHKTCQTVAAMLMSIYEDLDHLERLLGGTSTSCAQPSPPTRAALVGALQVIDIINGNLHGRDFAEFAVVERVQANLRFVMGTVAGVLCDLTLPGARGHVDLMAVMDQTKAVLDAFVANPAAELGSVTPL